MAEPVKRRLTLGTAGHIDHGKTTLVAALTGLPAQRLDRLAEERRRGVSIELGFADLALPDGRSLSVIDVPGHERLVRTMVAGATGIDLFLLVVAADDGVMPQTREHVAVLRALGVEIGVVAVTKADVAAPEAVASAEAGARALLPAAPLVVVSARSGAGLDELTAQLASAADVADSGLPRDGRDGPPILHVDRVFSLPGPGTIVTGTLRSGTIARGDRVQLLPAGVRARVRSVEVHDRGVERAEPRRRVAVALTGVRRDDVSRGDVLTSEDARLRPSFRLDVEPSAGLPAIAGERVQVHHGTRDTAARAVDLGEARLQLRLERPLIAMTGDRLVIRSIAPVDTLGGATVVDSSPPRRAMGWRTRDEAAPPPKPAEPPRPGPLDRGTLAVLALLESAGDAPPAPATLAEKLGVPAARVADALDRLVAAGRAVRVKPDIVYPVARLRRLEERLVALAGESGGELTLPGVRDELATSRKYAQALLEHLDAAGLTVRHGDRHVLRRPGERR